MEKENRKMSVFKETVQAYLTLQTAVDKWMGNKRGRRKTMPSDRDESFKEGPNVDASLTKAQSDVEKWKGSNRKNDKNLSSNRDELYRTEANETPKSFYDNIP